MPQGSGDTWGKEGMRDFASTKVRISHLSLQALLWGFHLVGVPVLVAQFSLISAKDKGLLAQGSSAPRPWNSSRTRPHSRR